MLTILFVVNNLKRRGAEQQLFSFVKSLPPWIEVIIFSFSNSYDHFPELYEYKGIRIYGNRYKGTYNIFRMGPLIACLTKERPDIVVTVGLGAALLFGRIGAFLLGGKIVYSLLNTYENFNNLPRLKGAYFDVLNQCVNRFIPLLSKQKAYRLLANSDQLADRVNQAVRRYPVHTFYNGLPVDKIERLIKLEENDKLYQIRQQMVGHPVIVQVGALDKNKNILFTLECLPEIRNSIADVRLLIIGQGPLEEKIYQRASKNGLKKNLILAGQIPIESCLALIKKSNIIVLTSHSESFPNVLVEGQALGLPAVTFDVGAAKEIVEDGISGFVVAPDDRRTFIDRTKELLADRIQAENMGKKGRDRVLSLFNMQRKVDFFLKMVKCDQEYTKHRTLND